MELIYCGSGNPRFYKIATAAGFQYGARLPDTVYGPLFFADQDFKNPDRAAYMAALAVYKPYMATVLDWEREEQLPEVLSWAEEAAQFIQRVVIVPKVMSGISRLPPRVAGHDVVLGYSVPTRYGGTQLPAWEFAGWPVHLLGGSPHAQMAIWRQLYPICEIVSTDGNMINLMATRFCQFWTPGNTRYANDRFWPMLKSADGDTWGQDAPYEAFRRSCSNIINEWQRITAEIGDMRHPDGNS